MPDHAPARGSPASPGTGHILAAPACGLLAAFCARLIGGGPAAWILVGCATGLAVYLAPAIRASLSRPSRSKALCDALRSNGADFASFSAFDGKAIGYDVTRSVILLATGDGSAGIGIADYPIDRVRSVTWQVPQSDPSPTYAIGPASFAGASQASAMNAEARRQALSEAGLAVQFAEPRPETLRVCLDGDEDRLRRWTDIIEKARSGLLAKPGTPVIV